MVERFQVVGSRATRVAAGQSSAGHSRQVCCRSPNAAGTVSLSDAMLSRGAGERDAHAFATEVEQLALSLSADTLSSATVVSLDAHASRLDHGPGFAG